MASYNRVYPLQCLPVEVEELIDFPLKTMHMNRFSQPIFKGNLIANGVNNAMIEGSDRRDFPRGFTDNRLI